MDLVVFDIQREVKLMLYDKIKKGKKQLNEITYL